MTLATHTGEITLACPACRASLSEAASLLQCCSCGREWPIVDGMPVFVEGGQYWGEVPQELMQRVVDRGREIGWRQAVDELLLPDYAKIASYVQEPCRADWRFLLPDTRGWTVLDAGAGWGPISLLLSGVCRWVVALENVRERARFIQLRAKQDGGANVRVVCADIIAPPLPEESFDLVVMNGVVEWLGLADTTRDPRDVQVSALGSVRRLLRPGGYLYVGIENRFGYPAFLGAEDHSGVKFTNLMPRRVANYYLQTLRREGYRVGRRTVRALQSYRTYTYSARGYRRLLADAGYESCEIYSSRPYYNRPLTIAPIGADQLIGYYTSHLAAPRSVRQRLVAMGEGVLAGLRLDSVLAPSFSIVAKRAD